MKRVLSFILLSLALMSYAPAMARASVPIVNHENVELGLPGSAPLDAARVQHAILAAAARKNWSVRTGADGEMEASLLVRGKHTVVVGIRYAANKLSLNYKSSVNMNFETRDGQPLIHPNYNKWVADLKQAIQLETQKP